MRRSAPRRWHGWVIVLGVLGLTVTGVWTLWGHDLRRLFKPDEASETATPAAGAETPAAPTRGQATGPL